METVTFRFTTPSVIMRTKPVEMVLSRSFLYFVLFIVEYVMDMLVSDIMKSKPQFVIGESLHQNDKSTIYQYVHHDRMFKARLDE